MIYSMTAFGRSQLKSDWGTAVWELRSINHRFLDITIKLPDTLRDLEQPLREIIQKAVHRGKIDCMLRFLPGAALGSSLTLNQTLLNQLIHLSTTAMARLPSTPLQLNVFDLLAWHGVVVEENADLTKVRDDLLAVFKKALDDLKAGRKREGLAIAAGIQKRLTRLSKNITVIKKNLPNLLERQREKMLQRLKEAKSSLDPQRLEQEMVYYAQKIDVSEEIERTLSHIAEVKRTLAKEEAAGRRLEFMMQELNREANTLASKSVDAQITHIAVALKVLVEEIREQVQNIE